MTSDKKQKIQIGVMGVLALGFVGNFAVKMMTPSPAAHPFNPKDPIQAVKKAANDPPAPPTVIDAMFTDAPLPTDSMKNPFTAGISADSAPPRAAVTRPARTAAYRKKTSAWAVSGFPNVAPLPTVSNQPGAYGTLPLPVSISGTASSTAAARGASDSDPGQSWNVNGVVDSGEESVAIMHNSTGRKFVRVGDVLPDGLRVVGISRSRVVLADHDKQYRIPLASSHSSAPKPILPSLRSPTDTENSTSASAENLKNLINMPTGGSQGQGTGSAP